MTIDELLREAPDLRELAARPCWSLAVEDRPLWDRLVELDPAAAALAERFAMTLVLPRRMRVSPPLWRPRRHRRAFYLELTELGGDESSGVLAVKGSEVTYDDVDAQLEALGEWPPYRVTLSSRGADGTEIGVATELGALEGFVVLERKIPCALLLDDALAEARAALRVQRAHVARHGELARVPVPVLVFEWPGEIAARHVERLRSRLRPHEHGFVQRAADHPLGCYVYHYPSIPLRVLDDEAGSCRPGPHHERMAELDQSFDVERAIDDWIELLARLLALGLLPIDPTSVLTGNCLQRQNLVLDGGFVDVDSVVAMAELGSARAVVGAVADAVSTLAESVAFLLGGPPGLRCPTPAEVTFAQHVVWEGVRAQLAAEAAAGATLDPRLLPLIGEPCAATLRSVFAALEDRRTSPALPGADTP